MSCEEARERVAAARASIAQAVGAAFKKMRTDAALTQQQLADRVGASASWVARIEGASRKPDFADLAAWAGACGVSLDEGLLTVADAVAGSPDAIGMQRLLAEDRWILRSLASRLATPETDR